MPKKIDFNTNGAHERAILNSDNVRQARQIYESYEGFENIFGEFFGESRSDFRYAEYDMYRSDEYGFLLEVKGGPLGFGRPVDPNDLSQGFTGHEMLFYISDDDAEWLFNNDNLDVGDFEEFVESNLTQVVVPKYAPNWDNGWASEPKGFWKDDEEGDMWWVCDEGKLVWAIDKPTEYSEELGIAGAFTSAIEERYDEEYDWIETKFDEIGFDPDGKEELKFNELDDVDKAKFYKFFEEDADLMNSIWEDVFEMMRRNEEESKLYPWFLYNEE